MSEYLEPASTPSAPERPYIGVSAGVRPSSLHLGQGGDEFAAELRDVRDHAAPDRVERRLGRPIPFPNIMLHGLCSLPLTRLV